MKSLLALLLLGLALAFGYWKTQYPDATVDDLTTGANEGITRLKGGIAAVVDGGAGQEAITGRLASIEADLAQTQRAADPSVTNSRLDSLEAALIATQQAVDPSEINDRLSDAERRMAASEMKLSEYENTLSASAESLSASADTSAAQVSAIESQLELLNRRVDEQTQQFNAESITSSLANLQSRISTLREDQQRTADEQNAALSGMGDKIDSFEARLNTLSSDASNGQAASVASVNAQIDQRIASLENKLDTTTADSLRIESMTNELSASRLKIQAMEKNASTTSEQIATLSRNLESLKTQSESSSIDDQQVQLRSQLQQLQGQMDQVGENADVAELTNALQATRDRIQTLEQRVIDLPASSSAATDATQAQSALQAQILALEKKLANVEAAPDENLVNSITQVEEKVSELAAKGFVTQEDLRAQQQQAKSTEYRIYFDRNSTAITEEAGIVLNSFIAQEKNRTTGVSIYGFTDRRGSAVYNQQLALQRATNVRSYLIQNGFSYTKIKSLSGLGEDAAAASIEDGQEDAQSRAVVLYAQQP